MRIRSTTAHGRIRWALARGRRSSTRRCGMRGRSGVSSMRRTGRRRRSCSLSNSMRALSTRRRILRWLLSARTGSLEDAVMPVTPAARTPAVFSTQLGPRLTGGAVTLGVSVITTDGNERSSDAAVMHRPLMRRGSRANKFPFGRIRSCAPGEAGLTPGP